jgi:hypothetical protein
VSEENRFFSDECARGPELGDFHIRRYPLVDVAEMTRYSETGRARGKVVVLVDQADRGPSPRRRCRNTLQFPYHRVFAPASADWARIVPKTRAAAANEHGEVSTTDRQRALTWTQRLKRAFAIEIETCRRCGGRLRVIASIEAPPVIARILEHLGRDIESVDPAHPSRAPSECDLWI